MHATYKDRLLTIDGEVAMPRPSCARALAGVATSVAAATLLLFDTADEISPVPLWTAAGLMLLATGATLHAILRPATPPLISETYQRSYHTVTSARPAREDRTRAPWR